MSVHVMALTATTTIDTNCRQACSPCEGALVHWFGVVRPASNLVEPLEKPPCPCSGTTPNSCERTLHAFSPLQWSGSGRFGAIEHPRTSAQHPTLRKPVGAIHCNCEFWYFHSISILLPFYFHSISIPGGWCFHSEEYFHSTRALRNMMADWGHPFPFSICHFHSYFHFHFSAISISISIFISI